MFVERKGRAQDPSQDDVHPTGEAGDVALSECHSYRHHPKRGGSCSTECSVGSLINAAIATLGPCAKPACRVNAATHTGRRKKVRQERRGHGSSFLHIFRPQTVPLILTQPGTRQFLAQSGFRSVGLSHRVMLQGISLTYFRPEAGTLKQKQTPFLLQVSPYSGS